MERAIIEVGYDKGVLDFGVNGSIQDMDYEQIKELRSMLITAIYIAEDMWRRGQKDETDQIKSPTKNH